MCDECDSVWLSPEHLDVDHVIIASPPEFIIPNLNCSIDSNKGSDWATRADIERYGWATYIAGESEV
jgi:hypothetical protein